MLSIEEDNLVRKSVEILKDHASIDQLLEGV